MELTLSLLLISLFTSTTAQTIQEIISRTPALTRLNAYVNKLPVFDLLRQESQQFTFLAPNNSAFLNIPARVQLDLRSNSNSAMQRSDDIFMYHIIPQQSLRRSELSQDVMHLSDATDSPPLFFRTSDGNVFVNGAQLSTEIVASNGVVHIIDTVMHETAVRSTALAYMEDAANRATTPTTKKFYQLLDLYRNEQGNKWRDLNGHRKITLFVPTDDYMNTLSPQIFNLIKTSKPVLKSVVDAHIITGRDLNDISSVYHSRLLENMALAAFDQNSPLNGISAAEGVIKPKKFGDKLYVSNSCAQGQVVKANITVGNGVIHLIDGMLGYLPHDIYKYLEVNRNTVSRFYALIGMANMQDFLQVPNQGVSSVPATDKYTLFVPTDNAFINIPDSRSISQDRTLLDKVIKMHLLQGELSMLDIDNSTVRDTLAEANPPIRAKFYRHGQDIMVEVDYVRGKVIRADTCVKNGIIHYVDHILGVPYFNLFDELTKNDELIDMVSLLRQVGLDQGLKNEKLKYTLFIPYNKAIELMRQQDIGRRFLDTQEPYRLEAFLRRHMVKGEYFLDQIPMGSTSILQTEAPGIEIGVEHSTNGKYYIKYGTKTIEVIERDMRNLNGMTNFINGTIYTEDPRDLKQISGASLPTFSLVCNILFITLWFLHC